MTRDERLESIKASALKQLDLGASPVDAITTLCCDMRHYPELANHKGIDIAMGFLLIGKLRTDREVREFIEGFR